MTKRSMDRAVEGLHMAVAALTVANEHPRRWLRDGELTAAHEWAKEAGPLASAIAVNHLAYMLVGFMDQAGMDIAAWIEVQGRAIAEHENHQRPPWEG